MNRLTIIGNLTRDPVTATTSTGKECCNFTVAVNRRGKKRDDGQQEADFFSVHAWNDLGANCQKYLAKGRKVAVIGPVSVSTYTANDGNVRANLDVAALEVEFLSSKGETEDGQNATSEPDAAAPASAPVPAGNLDELPF